MTATSMDPRIEERRRGVSEDNARHRLRLMLIVSVFIGAAALGAWVLQSPILSVREVVVRGAENSTALERLDSLSVVAGVPTISVKSAQVVEGLARDPWIQDSRVVVQWPGHVEIDIVEYVAAASVAIDGGWILVSNGGQILARTETPMSGLAIVDVGIASGVPGAMLKADEALAAVTFVDGIGSFGLEPTTVWMEDDELLAIVGGYSVRIGPIVEIEAKAAAVLAVLRSGIEPGSSIDVVSPTRPAVAIPQPVVEAQTEVTSES